MKRFTALAVSILLTALLFTACGEATREPETTAPPSATPADDGEIPDLSGATVIRLADDRTVIEGNGATYTAAGVTVTKAGVYVVEGTLSDGQLRVETEDTQTVYLVLRGATVHSATTAPLFVRRSAKTVLTLADGTDNVFSDSADATFEDTENEEPSGALFSKSDLTVNGNGTLTVKAAFRDGIVSRDGLTVAGGTVNVTAADDALMGRDHVVIRGGVLTLTAKGDGIKSTNDASADVGFVMLEGGTVTVTADKDGVQAESTLHIGGGTLKVTSGGHTNAPEDSRFAFGGFGGIASDTADTSDGKALKAGARLCVDGGEITLDAADDALHSNGDVELNGGVINASAGDDGVHADQTLCIKDGSLTVDTCYEGLEAATITVDGGEVRITASDDGINASSGSEEAATDGAVGGRFPMGGDPFASDGSALYLNGGTVHIDAQGDGIDSNGTVRMTGGTVTVIGPSNNGNGTFDFASDFDVTGGTLIAVGSSGMAQTPSSTAMNSIVWYGCSLQSGDRFAVTAADGTVVASLVATRNADWAYVLAPTITKGETYTLSDGNSENAVTHEGGLHSIGSSGLGGGPMGGMGRPGRPDGAGRPAFFG